MSSPFYVSDDEDDNTESWKVNPKKNFFDECYDNNDQFKQKIDEISRLQNSVLSSSKFCNQIINDSENIGALTSQELSEQREQLKRIEQNMNSLDANLNISQKHINSLKTFFGSVTNYFSTSRKNSLPANSSNSIKINSLPKIQDDDNDISKSTRNQMSQALKSNPIIKLDSASTIINEKKILKKKEFDSIFDQNLDDMSGGMNRLKEMALNMNQELDSQNYMLDNYLYKVDNTGNKLTEQNKQMKKILGGK
ncbi:unnamed protein product [Gordionus sp. m RMFG-2023]|uniref:soluble NSF attachment protein 29-like n=1 Tax=Gordionus sp. m RMFG-2023 TaxID=3053472 RepID=UPI0030DE0C0C